ncbi:ABC-2 type transport system permease protein [Rhodospirillales bacterium URHD0017]|nr:ABC-2 type transport system permease protein [Rhodospirillales bacterium URHD0017]
MTGARLPGRRFRGLLRKEFVQIVRDPSSIAIALVMPIVLLLLIGYGISLDARDVRFGLVDENPSVESASLYHSFASTRYFRPTRFVDARQAEAALMRGDIAGFAVLRGDFARKVADPLQPAEIGIFVNGVDANNARVVIGYALGTIENWASAYRRHRGQKGAPAVTLEQRYWFNPEIRSANFIVPGLIAMVMTMIGALLTALVVAREWERGTMEAMMVSPASMPEIIISKLCAYFVLGLGGLAVSVGLGIFVFGVPFRGSFPVLLLMSSVFLVVSLAMGLVISTVARSQFVAAQLAFLITFMPALILSGMMFDIASMPGWLQAVTTVFAARYFVSGLQTLFLAGTVWPILLPDLLALVGFAVLFLGVAIARTRRSLE